MKTSSGSWALVDASDDLSKACGLLKQWRESGAVLRLVEVLDPKPNSDGIVEEIAHRLKLVGRQHRA
jgi:hypothetical protein